MGDRMDGSESDEIEVDGAVSPAAPAESSGAMTDKKALPQTVQRCATNRWRPTHGASSASACEARPAGKQLTRMRASVAFGRRRPSLSNVLQGDSTDPTVQQALAKKLADAAADLANDAGGAPRYTQKSSTAVEDAGVKSPDATQIVFMPLILLLTFILFIVVTVKQRQFTEAVIDRDFEIYLEREAEHQILNEPIGAYVGCVGIIFALMYTSVYNDAQVRQSEIRNALAQEAGGVHTAMLLVRTLDADDNINKTRALLLFSSYIENLATEIFFKSQNHRDHEQVLQSSIESLYAAIPFLAEIASDGEGDEMDRVLIQRVVDALNRVCEARHRRVSEERHSVSMMTFVFLTVLAAFTFYGVSFLQMGAEGLTSSVVIMTGVSLLMSMAVLVSCADLSRHSAPDSI